jgi:hypothetical protein
MDLSYNTLSLVKINGTTASHICQRALWRKSLLRKEWRKQNIWKKMHLHLSKVGEEDL